MLRLYTYWRSSAAYRVRIALNLKGLEYESVAVHLGRDEHKGSYKEKNPQGLVPALEHDGQLLLQSLPIIDYLDSVFPEPAMVPREPVARARVQAMALIVAADIHPLNNLRVRRYLGDILKLEEEQKNAWYKLWIAEGFSAIETMLQDPATGKFCHDDTPTLADACLVPQVYNARRIDCDLSPYPEIMRIEAECLALDAFDRAVPEHQPDAP